MCDAYVRWIRMKIAQLISFVRYSTFFVSKEWIETADRNEMTNEDILDDVRYVQTDIPS